MAHTFLLEIGLEEVPAHLVTGAAEQLVKRTQAFLEQHRLDVAEIKSYSTPRRLAVQLIDVAENSASIDEEYRGPSLKIAKDDTGNWSKAAQGFARGKGATPDDFVEKDGYVFVSKHISGVPAIDILANIGSEVVEQMKFSTYMKWANFDFLYVRPIRWLVALFDSDIVDFSVLDVRSGRTTRGHRFLSSDNIDILNAQSYEETLALAHVVADAHQRKQKIRQQLDDIAAQHQWVLHVDEDLLEEVNNIVEWPTAFSGSFDEKYLAVPDEVLITSMREHQRFFFVTDQDQHLLPYFVSVRNGDANHLQNVIAGNEKVLIARLEDAVFFYQEDQQKTIADYMEKVKKLVFHEKIGSVYEHMQRVKQLAAQLAESFDFTTQQQQDLLRSADIYKFDLMTGMVGEFDELQGIMGEHYAKRFGESAAVAAAIKEHYLPVSADGDLPVSDVGAVLALADKLDSIISFFSAGLIPSGSNDPYGLRRAATGIVRILKDKKWHIALADVLATFIPKNSATKGADLQTILNFILDRVRKIESDKGIRSDIIAAGTQMKSISDIVYIDERVHVLAQHAQDDANFREVMETLTRVQKLAHGYVAQEEVQVALLENDAEQALYRLTHELNLDVLMNEGAEVVYTTLANLTQAIQDYFDNTMVMVDDERIKNNRLTQLSQINRLIMQLGDLNQIVTK